VRLERRIAVRAAAAGVEPDETLLAGLAALIGLLAKWNRTINLTGLEVSPPSDEAIDRLIVEALVAERLMSPSARLGLDVGSGGGSPSLPIALARPALRMVLVESRTRKCAFLREAVRELGLAEVEVANSRLEAMTTRPDLTGQVDVITLRAVRLDRRIWSHLLALAKVGGQVLHFGGPGAGPVPVEFFAPDGTVPLPRGGALTVYRSTA
jgi:16S rRNA (guanine527-N7)-methyltransferase